MRIQYHDFTLSEITHEFHPRTVYDNGDGYIICPLPQEGRTAFLIPKSLPLANPAHADTTPHPVNLTTAFRIEDRSLAQNIGATRDNDLVFLRFGHLTVFDLTKGPRRDSDLRQRLDLRDFDTADACQIIVHFQDTYVTYDGLIGTELRNQAILPAWRGQHACPNPGLKGLVDFHRHVINEREYIDYWLCDHTVDFFNQLRDEWHRELSRFLDNSAVHSH